MMEWVRAVTGTFVACFAFCFILNARGKFLFFAPLGSVLCWLSYLLCVRVMPELTAYFAATVLISVYAELMARRLKAPVTVFLLIGLLPLVPGGGIYYTMEYALSGDTFAFLSQGLTTFGIAGSMALGVLVVSSIVRLFTRLRRHDLLHQGPVA